MRAGVIISLHNWQKTTGPVACTGASGYVEVIVIDFHNVIMDILSVIIIWNIKDIWFVLPVIGFLLLKTMILWLTVQ